MISKTKCNSKKPLALIMLLVIQLLFQFSKLSAQNNVPDSLVKERIDFIQKMLDQGKPAAKLWWNGWLYGYSAATIGQGVLVLTSNKLNTRQDMALGAATTLIGAVGQLIEPMIPAKAPAMLAILPDNTPEERIIKLQKAEELFAASAEREKEGRSWKYQATTGVVNLGSGLITWLGFKRTVWAGLGNFALNTAICEAQIFTQPMRAARDYKRYCEMNKTGPAFSTYKPKAQLYVNGFPGGIALRLVF